jgi:hypothetical protein
VFRLFAEQGDLSGVRLVVLPSHVVESADGWASDGCVVPVMVVHVEPLVEGSRPGCL